MELLSILACPVCKGDLVAAEHAVRCERCGTTYEESRPGQPDLRLREPLRVSLDVELGAAGDAARVGAGELPANPEPELRVAPDEIPFRLTPQLVSWFPCAHEDDVPLLDLACGSAHHRPLLERTGFRYVGVDVDPTMEHATLLGDGQALPFRDETFGFVLSIATLEHVPHPRAFAREVFRVLRPGSRFVGTVAFLEPFHGTSYFHHTHAGVESLLHEAGFEVDVVAPAPGWSVLDAQAHMSLFPRLPSTLSAALVAPLQALHRLWWRLGARARRTERSSERYRALSTAGAICFVARKG